MILELFPLRGSVTFRPLVKQTTTRNLYITINIYFLEGRLCEVGAVRRGIRIVRRWGLNFSMSGDNGRDNAHSVTTREVSWTAGSFSSELPFVQFVGLILPSNSHAEIRTRLYASAILPILGDWDVSLPLPLEWPVWSSSSGNNYQSLPVHHFFYGTVRIFTLSHIVSQAVFYRRSEKIILRKAFGCQNFEN